MRGRRLAAAAAAALALGVVTGAGPAGAESDGPTCSAALGIEVHAQHIIGDYVTGVGHDTLEWPPKGQVGEAVGGGGGPLVKGGPGPGFHFENGFAPGASFCNPQAQSGIATENQQATKK